MHPVAVLLLGVSHAWAGPPNSSFTADSDVCLGDPVTLTANATSAPTYLWDLGDGTIASTASVQHTYAEPDAFEVSLTVTNPADPGYQHIDLASTAQGLQSGDLRDDYFVASEGLRITQTGGQLIFSPSGIGVNRSADPDYWQLGSGETLRFDFEDGAETAIGYTVDGSSGTPSILVEAWGSEGSSLGSYVADQSTQDLSSQFGYPIAAFELRPSSGSIVVRSIRRYTDTTTTTSVIDVHALPTVDAGSTEAACSNDTAFSVAGSATPAGGTWSGTGVASDGTFDPSAAGAGDHTLTYAYADEYSCGGSDALTATVYAAPTVEAGNSAAFCAGAASSDLSGGASPASGTWSGTGVDSGGTFDPGTAGIGAHTLTYSYTDGNTCSNSDTLTATVHALPSVEAGADHAFCVDIPARDLSGGASPASGTWSGTGVNGSGTFDPGTAGVGAHTLTYSYTDGNTCSSADTLTATVYALPTVEAGSDTSMCSNAGTTAIGGGASPASGAWSGPGVDSSGQFDPASAGAGEHTLTYGYTDGNTCTGADTLKVTVLSAPSVEAGNDISLCADDVATDLSSGASPASGTWSGTGVTSGGSFDPSTGAGSYTLTYTYSDGNACSDSDTLQATVTAVITGDAGADQTVCVDDAPLDLSSGATPASGTWTGPGVSGVGLFDPDSAGVGSHSLVYTPPGDCADSDAITVAVLALTDALCADDTGDTGDDTGADDTGADDTGDDTGEDRSNDDTEGCGCASTNAPTGLWLLGLLALTAGRRRSRHDFRIG